MKKRKSLKKMRLNKKNISRLRKVTGGVASNSWPICQSDLCPSNLTCKTCDKCEIKQVKVFINKI